MPFTLSHPAAVIPIRKLLNNKCILSALVVGSLSPDFSYFFQLTFLSIQTHSIAALFWFCLPLGLISYLFFHRTLKLPLYTLLPKGFQSRIQPEQLHSYSPINTSVVLSVLIGALTHIVWDSFTHAGSTIVEHFAFFKTLLFEVGSYKVWMYKLLQHGSSLLGLVIILYCVYNWFRTTHPSQAELLPKMNTKTKRLISLVLIVTPLIISILLQLDDFPTSYNLATLQPVVGLVIKSYLSYFFIAITSYALLFRYFFQ